MATAADPASLAAQARRVYSEELVKGLVALVQAALDEARVLMDKPGEHATALRRREVFQELNKGAQAWHRAMVNGLRQALLHGVGASRMAELTLPQATSAQLSLVSDDTIEVEIVASRLALAIMDRASWEFSDLRSRVAHLERRAELDPHDMLRAHVLARIVFDAWRAAGQTLVGWRELQPVLHDEFAALVEEAYHESNRWLVERGVLPEVDLRPFIRRARTNPLAPLGWQAGSGFGPSDRSPGSGRGYGSGIGDETRMMTQAAPMLRSRDHAEAVLGRLNRLVGRHLPNFGHTGPTAPMSPRLAQAIQTAEMGIRTRLAPGGGGAVTTPVLLDELHQRKQALKKAAATPEERATIEIVALLFQSILTEERIPSAVRVWFARLQMPVLRVAVTEPDFFATIDHPARRLIDRMGACVMGFDRGGQAVGEGLEKEIKRIVQVVEAYPDTGRRVFQTVLTEFEKFLERYFQSENEVTRHGVSLAQQIEQRETLAIQYTIELRRMLNEVPVQEGVRQFLFQVWADVLATNAVRHGNQSDQIKNMKRAATDLIWSAGAKVTREERGEVIRRLPLLLKALREGMASSGLDSDKQDEHIQLLNNSLAAAFTAKTAVIPDDRLRELMERLETLEELLPDADDIEIDESMVLDLSGHQNGDLEVVVDGGSMPNPAMLAWARELQVGSWYMLDYRDRHEAVQLVWQGMRKQLSMFVSPQGRSVLFPQQRLAAFLQAGLLVPAQDESLTVRATRNALAKLDVDASRLVN
jgi:hypothetical protein